MSMTINSYKYNTSIYANNNNKPAKNMASAKRINSAADDAAGLAISEKLQAIINGLGKGSENSLDMQGLLNTAEGGMSAVSDSLQRVRQLSLQSQNGIYTDDDRALLQNEVGQLLNHVDRTATSTEFNNKTLLDGSAQNLHTSSYADGSGMNVSIPEISSSSLGIIDYNITEAFDIGEIDNALAKVSTARSSVGAASNRLDHSVDFARKSETDQAEALSRILDTNYAKETINYSTNRLLQQYKNFSMKQQMAQMGNLVNVML